MFVNVSPAVYNLGETLCSLNFASRCRNIELGQAKKQTIDDSGNSGGSVGGSAGAVAGGASASARASLVRRSSSASTLSMSAGAGSSDVSPRSSSSRSSLGTPSTRK